jgi:Zn-dependent protease
MATPPPPHRWSVVVARVASIDIRVHASFVLLVALFALAAPEPGWSGVALSLLWLVILFSSVVAHELAHSLVARRKGGVVHEILLFPLGGISKLERLPETPRDELEIAAAGPLTSLAIGVGALTAGAALGRALLPIDLLHGAWLMRIAWMNLILGVFNLIPAFPLDGGRVLRAVLERRRDLLTATRIATRVGHALAALLIVAGVMFDIWLALIGIFVYFGASAEEAGTIAHERLRGHRVRELTVRAPNLSDPGAAVPDDDAVSIDAPIDLDLLARLEHHRGSLVVVEDGAPVGLLLLADVGRLLAPDERDRRPGSPGTLGPADPVTRSAR